MAAAKRFQLVADIPAPILKKYLAADVIAVDSELQGLRLRRDQVCLVQLCDRKDNVSLVRITPPKVPPNLKKLMTASSVVKIFHFAITDVAFMRTSLGLSVTPYHCTKVMSKLVRTYTESHSLNSLTGELLNLKLDKQSQSTDWGNPKLSNKQLVYAANDVLHLIKVYETLQKMLKQRGKLPSGISAVEMNKQAQACLPTIVELLVNGYGDRDGGWETSLFAH